MKRLHADYIRSIIFGFEDSLVSTTGVIAGVSTGTQDPKIILLAASVTIVVEALSMGAGQFLSERSVHQMEKTHTDNLVLGGSLMFGSYAVAGIIPLVPVMLFSFPTSVFVSIALAFLSLFALGYIKGKIVQVSPLRSGVEILAVGGVATLLGVLAGYFFRTT
jgi:VIT1/CCC1 family predicted Fe2+/Mn2+ transporter